MSESRPQMIARTVQENLRLVLEPAKRARVNDPCAVTLKFRPIRMALLRILASTGIARFLRECSQRSALRRFHFLARFPAVPHLFVVDSADCNFSRSTRSALFASSLTANKSKIASSVAVTVSQMHPNQ